MDLGWLVRVYCAGSEAMAQAPGPLVIRRRLPAHLPHDAHVRAALDNRRGRGWSSALRRWEAGADPQMAAIRKNHRNRVDFGSPQTSFWVKEDARAIVLT